MTRGRKKDMTIPPTRSLVQQRDYRARKASYVTSLEERCRRAEEENAQLRHELMQTRARLANPAILLPETAEASKDLLHNIALTAASLAKFQRLAFGDAQTNEPITTSPSLPPQISAQVPLENQTQAKDTHPSNTFGKKHFYVGNTPPFSSESPNTAVSHFRSRSPDSEEEEECCGGMLDCDALGHDGVIEDDSDEYSRTQPRMSGLRSTSTTSTYHRP